MSLTGRSRRLRPSVRRGAPALVLGSAAAVLLGVLAAPVGGQQATAPAVVRVAPVLPPVGGFEVSADRMDQALGELVAARTGRPVRSAYDGGREEVVVGPGGRLAVRSGAVLVGARDDATLVTVDVRRADAPACGDQPSCVRTGDDRSRAVVVVRDGVEVRVSAAAGLRVLPRAALVELADSAVWR